MLGKGIRAIAVMATLSAAGMANANQLNLLPGIPATMTGTVVSVTPSGGGTCETTGSSIRGESAQDFKSGAFGVVIAPDAIVKNGLVYEFKTLTSGTMSYGYPLIAFSSTGTFAVSSLEKQGRFVTGFTLTTVTGSQDGRPTGTCTTTYNLNFKAGVPTQIKTLLKNLM